MTRICSYHGTPLPCAKCADLLRQGITGLDAEGNVTDRAVTPDPREGDPWYRFGQPFLGPFPLPDTFRFKQDRGTCAAPGCENTVRSLRADARYCSGRCRMRALRERG